MGEMLVRATPTKSCGCRPRTSGSYWRADALRMPRIAVASTWRGVGAGFGLWRRAAHHHIRRDLSMREVDFRHLRSALKSLSSSTDLVLERGRVRAVLSHQASPYASHRGVRFELVHEPLGDDVLLAVNYRKILLVGRKEDAVRQATEDIGRDGRSEEHTSELQSRENLVCRLLLEKKKDTDRSADH